MQSETDGRRASVSRREAPAQLMLVDAGICSDDASRWVPHCGVYAAGALHSTRRLAVWALPRTLMARTELVRFAMRSNTASTVAASRPTPISVISSEPPGSASSDTASRELPFEKAPRPRTAVNSSSVMGLKTTPTTTCSGHVADRDRAPHAHVQPM